MGKSIMKRASMDMCSFRRGLIDFDLRGKIRRNFLESLLITNRMCRVDMTTSPFLINCSSSAEATLNEKEKENIKNNSGKNS